MILTMKIEEDKLRMILYHNSLTTTITREETVAPDEDPVRSIVHIMPEMNYYLNHAFN